MIKNQEILKTIWRYYMQREQMMQLSLNLMQNTEAVYLTTVNTDGMPNTRAMLNLRNTGSYPDLENFFTEYNQKLITFFTTNTSSGKVAQIKLNPFVCAYYCIPKQFQGVMLGGKIDIVTKENFKKKLWQTEWEIFYPKGADDPDYAVLRLTPVVIKGWAQMNRFELNLATFYESIKFGTD